MFEWYGTFELMRCATAFCPTPVWISVLPSAGALSPRSLPMTPPAPPTFSTGTGCFSCLPGSSESMRAITSLVPPAGKGEIS